MKNKVIKKLVSSILTLVIALSTILIIYATIWMDDKSIVGYRIFIVTTGSMQGSINQGDFILTKKLPLEQLTENDIITFVSSEEEIAGKINTHRIVSIDGTDYYTKGDANLEADDMPVDGSDIIGKVIFQSHMLGRIIGFLATPVNMVLFLAFPILMISLLDYLNIRKKQKNVSQDETEKQSDETEK